MIYLCESSLQLAKEIVIINPHSIVLRFAEVYTICVNVISEYENIELRRMGIPGSQYSLSLDSKN